MKTGLAGTRTSIILPSILLKELKISRLIWKKIESIGKCQMNSDSCTTLGLKEEENVFCLEPRTPWIQIQSNDTKNPSIVCLMSSMMSETSNKRNKNSSFSWTVAS